MLLIYIPPPKITNYTNSNMYIHTVRENNIDAPKMQNNYYSIGCSL